MESNNADLLGPAVTALNSGDCEPLLGLMSDDMVWSGFSRGWLWWRETPS